MAHRKNKGKTWRKIKVNNSEHFGKILNVRCCCEGESIIGQAVVSISSVLDFFGDELAIKSHA